MTDIRSWRDRAACRDLVTADNDPFFADTDQGIQAAIAVCATCPGAGGLPDVPGAHRPAAIPSTPQHLLRPRRPTPLPDLHAGSATRPSFGRRWLGCGMSMCRPPSPRIRVCPRQPAVAGGRHGAGRDSAGVGGGPSRRGAVRRPPLAPGQPRRGRPGAVPPGQASQRPQAGLDSQRPGDAPTARSACTPPWSWSSPPSPPWPA